MRWRNHLFLEYSLWKFAHSVPVKYWRKLIFKWFLVSPTLFPVAQFGDGNILISLFLSSSIICSGAHSLLAHTNTDVHTSVQKGWYSLLHVKGGTFLLHRGFIGVGFSFPFNLAFQFRHLHWYIKLPINSHENQEIITLQHSIYFQLCAELHNMQAQ